MVKILLILALCLSFLPNTRGETNDYEHERDWTIDFTVTNTASNPVRVLKWVTPLDDRLAYPCFTVTFNGLVILKKKKIKKK